MPGPSHGFPFFRSQSRLHGRLPALLPMLLLLICASPGWSAPYTVDNTFRKLQPRYPQLALPVGEVAGPEGVILESGLVYKTLGDRALRLDLYRPTASRQESRGLLLLIHGGGWQSGSREMLAPLARAVARQGYVVASISYRLSGEAPFPAAFDDARDALLWLIINHGRFNIDPRKIAIAGGSAGGQLAALLAYSGGVLEVGVARRLFPVRALINIDGLSDFTSQEALPFENDPAKNPSAAGAWFGGRYEDVPERWRLGSPIYHLDAYAPPTLFINSDQARFHAGRDAVIERLQAMGTRSEIVFFADSPHAFWHFEPWFTPTFEAVVDFLDRHL